MLRLQSSRIITSICELNKEKRAPEQHQCIRLNYILTVKKTSFAGGLFIYICFINTG